MTRSQAAAWPFPIHIFDNDGLLISFVLLMSLTASCSQSSNISSAVFSTNNSGETVVQATKDALKMLGYQAGEKLESTTASEGSRSIHGEKSGGMVTALGPATVHIEVVIIPSEKGSHIQVDVIPPKGAYGSTSLVLHDYQYALSQLIPDLSVKSRIVPKEWM